jgi:hypothetical protein
MNRHTCLEALVPHITDQLVVPSVSGQWIWGQLCKHDGNLLLGSMGNALGVAKDSGVARAVTVRDFEAFNREMSLALNDPGPHFIVSKVAETFEHRQAERSDVDLVESKYRFVRYIERTEGKPVFLGRG